MSYYLLDFTNKIQDYNFDNIIIGRKIKIDQETSKYYIYYQNDQTDTPKEIYLRLPKLRLIYGLANHKYNQINIPIYPNWDLTNNFVDFIQTLESSIEECFNGKKIQKEFVSLITKRNFINFIKANINDNVKITSNIENQQNITLNDFKINGQIEIVIKISYIWSKNTKIGLSSQIYQIKYWAPPDQLNINFIDPEPLSNIPNIPNMPNMPKSLLSQIMAIPSAPPMPCFGSNSNIDKTNNQKPNIELPQQLKFKVVPSVKDLQKAIKKLKTINNKEENNEIDA